MTEKVAREGARRAAFGGRGPDVGDSRADPVGTVRRSPNGKMIALQWPSRPHPYTWAVSDASGALGYEAPGRVAHWPVVGAVPFSPAAGVPLDGSVPTPGPGQTRKVGTKRRVRTETSVGDVL